eukprot:TRINITY_DN16295_c0_g1_i2.p1 TRINITY_DN16295_c0_g1~~TRINITY_DN16295_c0_g1_i2.p1  ORF type:complete len:767 (+),score=104.83 TRINITY_DN16295_c0_g1_i2:52-2352(+)
MGWDPHPPTGPIRRVSSARVGLRRESQPTRKSRPCSASLQMRPSWAMDALMMMSLRRSWEAESGTHSQLNSVTKEEDIARTQLSRDEESRRSEIVTAFERGTCLLKRRRPSTAVPIRTMMPPCSDDPIIVYHRNRRLLNRQYFAVREATLNHESIEWDDLLLSQKRGLQSAENRAIAIRRAWINRAKGDRRMVASVEKISTFFLSAKRGDFGKRALRRQICIQRHHLANKQVSMVKDLNLKMRRTLNREIELHAQSEIHRDRQTVRQQESVARDVIICSEESGCQEIELLFEKSVQALRSEKNMYTLELAEASARRDILRQTARATQTLRRNYEFSTLLVLPSFAEAAKNIGQFWRSWKSGKYSVRARRCALRLELRRDREKRVIEKMGSITDYINEMRNELRKETKEPPPRNVEKKKEWARISKQRMDSLEEYHELQKFLPEKGKKTGLRVAVRNKSRDYRNMYCSERRVARSPLPLSLKSYLSIEEVSHYEQIARSAICSSYSDLRSARLCPLFQGFTLQCRETDTRGAIFDDNVADMLQIATVFEFHAIECSHLEIAMDIRLLEQKEVMSMFDSCRGIQFPTCPATVSSEEALTRRGIVQYKIGQLSAIVQSWLGGFQHHQEARCDLLTAQVRSRKQIFDMATISFWHINNFFKTGEMGEYTSTVTVTETTKRHDIIYEEQVGRRDHLFHLEEGLFSSSWKQTRRLEASEKSARENICDHEQASFSTLIPITDTVPRVVKLRSPWMSAWKSLLRPPPGGSVRK